MSKLTANNLPLCCQSRKMCFRDATWGTYRFAPGQTDVDLNMPARVFCGQHKPVLDYRAHMSHNGLRNVRIR